MAESYPLYWPEGWKRTSYRDHSRFKTGFGAARNDLFAELGRLGAQKVILSTNIPLRNDGLPRANMTPLGGDPGVAVYFKRKGKDMVLACDKYRSTAENIYAIAKTIDAMRGIERWGASEMMERAFSGFQGLPASTGENWWDVLECSPLASREVVEAQYRAKARTAHPDTGGSEAAMQRLNAARMAATAARAA